MFSVRYYIVDIGGKDVVVGFGESQLSSSACGRRSSVPALGLTVLVHVKFCGLGPF